MDINNQRQLDKTIPVPLYYQLKQFIVDDIQQGRLAVGESIKTELELCEQYNISRVTVRQALMELVSEGYLVRRKGKGTFVSKPKIEAKFFTKLQSFNDEIIQKGMKPSTKVLGVEILEGIEKINSKLNISPDTKLIKIKRLRFANDDPIVYLETYLPHNHYHEIIKEDYENNSLYSILRIKYDTNIVHVTRQIEAVNCNQEEAELLQIDYYDAICLVHTIGFDQNESPVEYSVARYRGDLNQFTVELYDN